MYDLALMGHPYSPGISKIQGTNLNYICVSLANSFDTINGGTYTGLTQVVHQGAGWRFHYTASPGLEISGGFGARVLSGSKLGINSGGTLDFTSGSLMTGTIDATVTIAGTGNWTFATGKDVVFQSGTDIDMSGTVTVSSTGEITFASGADLTLQSGAILTGAVGSTINVNGAENIKSGATWAVQSGGNAQIESGGVLKLMGTVTPTYDSARTFTRTANPVAAYNFSNYASPVHQTPAGNYTYNTLSNGTDAWLMFAIDPPDGCTITSCAIRIDPPLHTNKPAIMPELHLYVQNVTDGSALGDSSQTDTSADATAFSAAHTITIGSLSVVVDKSTKAYWLGFRGYGITDGVSGCRVDIPKFTCTRAKLGEE